jgi:hypothetical protein
MSDPEIKAEAVYNKQECIDSFMSNKDLSTTEQHLRRRIIDSNNVLTRKGHELEHARRTLEVMEKEFQELRSQTNGLIEFAFAIEIERRETAGKEKANGPNGVTPPAKELRHGA